MSHRQSLPACRLPSCRPPRLPPQALASAFHGRIAFGYAAPAAHGAVVGALPPPPPSAGAAAAGGSRLYTICNGDTATAELYAGKLKSDPLARQLRQYSGGKKCAARVVITPDTDLAGLSIAQLKGLVQGRGVDCRGCAEKGDFVAALRQALQAKQEL